MIAIVVAIVVAVVWEAVPGADGSPRPGRDYVSPGVSWLGHAPNVVAYEPQRYGVFKLLLKCDLTIITFFSSNVFIPR